MQNTENNIEFYLLTIQSVQKYLIEKSIKLYDIILPFIQFYEVYDIPFRIQSKAYKFLDPNTYNPQSPIPNPQSPIPIFYIIFILIALISYKF